MGLFQRFKKGAPEPGDEDRRTGRSPDQARDSVTDLAEELRALQTEIKLLRESLAGGGERESGSSQADPRRNRRGGRGRARGKEGSQDSGSDRKPERRSLPKTPPEDAPVGPLVDYLKGRKVTVFEASDDLNRNEAFEHLARHLGAHFDVLSPFYEKMKRCVATNRGQRIDIDHFSSEERSAAVQFGTLLHRHGMLKDFYYHRSPKKQLRVIPTKDGQVGQFLTGGWLEIYVSLQLQRRLKAKFSEAKFQLLYNVKGTLPDGREFEADLMAVVEGKLLWLECKTGHWQDYAARFRGLVDIFGVDRSTGGLLLIRPPDQGTRQRATDMLNMTLLSLNEVDAFFNSFLGLEGEEAAALSEVPGVLPVGTLPPLSDDEIPLEGADPAKTLGRVSLDGESSEESADGPRRKRRRRRGGRGRGRNRGEGTETVEGGEASASSESGEGAKSLHDLHELLPLDDGDSGAESDSKSSSGGTSMESLIAAVAANSGSDSAPDAPASVKGVGSSEEASTSEDASEAVIEDPLAGLPPGMIASGSSDSDSEEKPKRKRSRGRRGGRGRASDASADASASVNEVDSPAEQSASDSDSSSAESASGESASETSSESEDTPSEATPKRSRRRRPRKSPFAVDEDAAEAAEAAESGDSSETPKAAEETATPKVEVESPAEVVAEETPAAEPEVITEPEPEPEVEPAPETEPVAEAEPEIEPEPEVEPEPEPEPEPAEEPAPAPTTSAKGTVIAPDLAAMMAGSTKKKAEDE